MIRVLEVITTSLAVRNVSQAADDFRELFGLEPAAEMETVGVVPIQSRYQAFRPGSGAFSVMDSTDPTGPIDRFVQRRGEGVFSITLRVADLDAACAWLRKKGVALVLDEPMQVNNSHMGGRLVKRGRVNFVKPQARTHGVLFELAEILGEA